MGTATSAICQTYMSCTKYQPIEIEAVEKLFSPRTPTLEVQTGVVVHSVTNFKVLSVSREL